MKKLTYCVAVATIVLFAGVANAQTSVDNLKKYCDIYPAAQFMLNDCGSELTHNIVSGEYGALADPDGTAFAFEMTAIYQWGHRDIRLGNVANDIWSLISKQKNGEPGALVKSPGNFFPTKDKDGIPMFAVIAWSRLHNRWLITAFPVSKVKTAKTGSRIFTKGA